LFPQPADREEKFRGKKLGQYLFFKSGGKVSAEEMRDTAIYCEWLSSGKLHAMKNRSLYCDLNEIEDVSITDEYAAQSTLKIAKYSVAMCKKL
jgi:hypothetical protein